MKCLMALKSIQQVYNETNLKNILVKKYWKRLMNKQKENSSTRIRKDMSLFKETGDDFSSIKIVEGKYKDVIYQICKVQF